MTTDNTFIGVDDQVLVEAIRQTKQQLVFVAPGLRKTVAEALASAMRVVPVENIHLVVDVDSEVCRLGYGSMAGLEILQQAANKHATTVNHHPGIRIGLIIADDLTLIYSPTPLLIETGSNHPNKPSGIVLKGDLPKALADACALGKDRHATLEVGKDAVDATKVNEVRKDLAERPAKKFNVARIERVFSSLLHYVEFRIEDYKLTTRSMLLKPHLFGVKSEEIVRRLRNRYKLFSETDSLIVEIPAVAADGKADPKKPKEEFGPLSVDRERNRIKKRFVIEAGEFGSLILRRDVPEFEKEITLLRARMNAYRDAVQAELKKRTEEIVTELLAALKEKLKTDPPEHWRSRFLQKEPTDEDIRRLFEEDVRSEVSRVNTEFNPRVFTAYKDVTYQTFKDEKFRQVMEQRFGKDAIDRIFSEHDVAPEDQAD